MYPNPTMRYDDELKLMLIRRLIELRVPHRAIEQCLRALDEVELEIEQQNQETQTALAPFMMQWNG